MERSFGNPENTADNELSLETVVLVLEKWRQEPRVADTRIQAYAIAFHERLLNDARLRHSIQYMVDYQNDPTTLEIGGTSEPTIHTPEQAADQILRSLQHIAMIIEELPELIQKLHEISRNKAEQDMQVVYLPDSRFKFPGDFTNPEAWDNLIEYILCNPYLHEMFDFNLSHRRVQTNVADRYKGTHIPMSILADRYFPGEAIRWLDIGTSIGLGPRAEIKGIPFSLNLDVKRQVPDPYSRSGFSYLDDFRTSRDFVNRLEKPINFEHVAGVDLTGFNDITQIMWARASYYPTELHIRSIIQQFDKLRAIEDPRLSFHVANFADKNSVARFQAETMHNDYHFVTAVTMHHQLSDADIVEFDRLAKSVLGPNGIYLRQGFMHVKPDSPTGFYLPDEWGPLDYRTIMESPDLGIPPTEILLWQNARGNEVVIPRGNDARQHLGL